MTARHVACIASAILSLNPGGRTCVPYSCCNNVPQLQPSSRSE
eukprot:CAMPEP_0195149160 /NCGR_PEP_ID=MMETSP0448-20130528/176593_1 /TAXON_ID=66468 /ORGANISM="Heterocapsa triquestra, Strain CCMP 448" /LENGTH=42 /DNA_ID= /DNA_START= /DNA_END= /DNA_ORIENTATION=